MKNLWPLTLMLTLLLVIGCSTEDELSGISEIESSNLSLNEILSDDDLISAKRPRPSIWADCGMYSGIVVPATFKPESDPFDELYGLPEGSSFKYGFPLISESKPGDQDYNGGRWHMNVLKESVDPAKYVNACSVEDLDLDDFESTPNYFGCPMKKQKVK